MFGRPGAGPAIVFSFIVAAIACGFAALCYAELAAMIPVSGSAYTYSYATLGEIVAWIIGWDLILEYAVGNMAVAVGWSGYFVQLCGSLFGIKFPLWAVTDYRTATDILATGGDKLQDFSSTTLPVIAGHPIALNLPAFVIVAAVTTLLVYGIRESAKTNTWIVMTKVAVVIFVIAFGAFWCIRATGIHLCHLVSRGMMGGAAIVFFAFIGFEAVSTTAEETRNPQRNMPIGIIASLIICTILYVLMSGVLTGIKKYTVYLGDSAAVATAFGGRPWAQALVSAGALAGMTSVLLVFQLGQPRIFMAMARDGLLPQYFARIHHRFRTPYITTIWTGVAVGGVAMLTDIGSLADLTNIRNAFCLRPCLHRCRCFTTNKCRPAAPIPRSDGSAFSDSRGNLVRYAYAQFTARNVGTFFCLARNRAADLFLLQRAPQQAASRHRRGRNGKYFSADRALRSTIILCAMPPAARERLYRRFRATRTSSSLLNRVRASWSLRRRNGVFPDRCRGC